MSGTSHYPIRGGVAGRERLRVLSRVMRASTNALLRRCGLRSGIQCLDVGCGGGDVAFDMARMVGPRGHVVGTDIDPVKLDLARAEAAEQNLRNLEFQFGDILRDQLFGFDLVHARFLLTHLADPGGALTSMWNALRPGGILTIEDIDFTGHFCYPDNAAFRRYAELYVDVARSKGGDANLGPRLPSLVSAAGFVDVKMSVTQHASADDLDVKLLTPMTMENIADAVLSAGLADQAEIDQVVADLYTFARTPGTIGSTPRIFEVSARRPD